MYRGKIYKDGKHWIVAVPALDLLTQGDTKNDAYEMLDDWLKTAMGKDFRPDIARLANGNFIVDGRDEYSKKALIALMLKRQRIRAGLTLADMQRLLQATSKNAYARYEQGVSVPSPLKIEEILMAMGLRLEMRVRSDKYNEEITTY